MKIFGLYDELMNFDNIKPNGTMINKQSGNSSLRSTKKLKFFTISIKKTFNCL